MYVSIKPVDHLDNKNLAKNRRRDVLWIGGNSILGHIFLGDPGYLFQEGKFYAGSDFPEGRRGGVRTGKVYTTRPGFKVRMGVIVMKNPNC